MSVEYRLEVPDQYLEELSACDTSVKAVAKWVDALPKANIGETSRLVYSAVEDLAHLVIDAKTRFEMLELVRPAVHYVVDALGKHFMNQPPMLQEKQVKVSNLAQALQIDLALGYKIVAKQLSEEPRTDHTLLSTSIHRAISELSQILLRACQLYSSAPDNQWLDLHQLYRIAEDLDIANTEVVEPVNRVSQKSSVADAYKRALLLGTSRPNQLRQKDLQLIYDALELWTPKVDICKQIQGHEFFTFDVEVDAPPAYRGISGVTDAATGLRALDSANLIAGFTTLSKTLESRGTPPSGPDDIKIIDGVSTQLLDHLVSAWGVFSERAFARRDAEGILTLCVGLSAAQYFISGNIDFDKQMAGGVALTLEDDSNPFLSRDVGLQGRSHLNTTNASGDPWGHAFDAGGATFQDVNVDMLERILNSKSPTSTGGAPVTRAERLAHLSDTEPTQPLHEVRLVNTSPGGYCVDWEGEASERIQDGQVVALREENEQVWSVGVIRWIQRRDARHLRTGIEMIAAKAYACGVALLHKTNAKVDFMRALEVPEIEAVNIAATLIVPNVPFRRGNKVYINKLGTITKAVLNQPVRTTGAFTQFEYTTIAIGGLEHAESHKTPSSGDQGGGLSIDDAESFWANL